LYALRGLGGSRQRRGNNAGGNSVKNSIVIATFLVAAAGAAGVAALPNPFYGSDTLFDITRAVIAAQPNSPLNSLAASYIGGGSVAGDTAMAANPPATARQQTAPMSRMIKAEGNVCSYNGGTNGSGDTKAAGIVIALDAVDLLSASNAGGSTSCQGPDDTQANDNLGYGFVYSGTPAAVGGATPTNSAVFTTPAGTTNPNQTWKWALALVYGGYDYSLTGGGPNGFPDCGQQSRRNLVANWNNLFQKAGCTNSNAACQALLCNDNGTLDSTGNATCFAATASAGTGPGSATATVCGVDAANLICPGAGATAGGNATCSGGTFGEPCGLVCSTGLATNNAPCAPVSATTATPCGTGGHCQASGVTCVHKATCQPGPTNPGGTTGGPGPLWHAFRPDDTSATADVFSSILGLQSPTFKPLGAALSISSSNNNGFGTSPYCNALNANSLATNTTSPCAMGPNEQYVGPGGVPDPVSDPTGALGWRRPPPGAWGDAPDPSQQQVNSADVMPTQFQDNDPIRRPCLGSAHFSYFPYDLSGTGNVAIPGEEVCNIDQALGLVLPMADTSSLVGATAQYPGTQAGSFIYDVGYGPTVLTCPAYGSWATHNVQHHYGQCPNGDATAAGKCVVPADSNLPPTTTLVIADKSTVDPAPIRPFCQGFYGSTTAASKTNNGLTLNVQLICSDGGALNDDSAGNATCAAVGAIAGMACGSAAFGGPGTCIAANLNNTTSTNSGCIANRGNSEGRAFNMFLWNGSVTNVKYAQYTIPAITQTTFDFTGAYSRIHQYETALGGAASACQYQDMTDQIGCLVQADPCSIGFAGNAAKYDAVPGGVANGVATNPPRAGTNGPLGTFDSVRVAQVYPGTSAVQLLGLGGEYQLARKLYFNSLVGFAQLGTAATATWTDNGTDELQIARYEAQNVLVCSDNSAAGNATCAGVAAFAGETCGTIGGACVVSAASATAMQNIISGHKEFLLGFQSAMLTGSTTGAPFCEDFNEQLICNDSSTTATANVNACITNALAVYIGANANTVCGDGIRGPYEECDNGTFAAPAHGHTSGNSGSDLTAGGCSTTCRCNNAFVTSSTQVECSDHTPTGNITCNTSLTNVGFVATTNGTVACGTNGVCVALGSCN
jgi:hypothetical protein